MAMECWENHGEIQGTFETQEFLNRSLYHFIPLSFIRGFLVMISIIPWESWGLRQHWCSQHAGKTIYEILIRQWAGLCRQVTFETMSFTDMLFESRRF